MSFLTTQPEELAAAAGKLDTVGAAMAAQNAASAAPTTTGVIPAAADEVSALQASLFTAYGTLYQQVSGEAAAMYDMFVNTLGMSAGTYSAAEAANSSAAASPVSAISSTAASLPGVSSGPVSDIANIVNIGAGNWASAASDLIGLTGGGLLPQPEDAEIAGGAAEGLEGAGLSDLGAAAAVGGTPIAAGVGQASAIGALSAPPSWAGGANLVSSTTTGALQGMGWTTAAPQAAPGTVLPGMPGMAGIAGASRNSARFGAPRYGVKPIVMPKPEVV
jgi:hypothetical protein